MRPAPLHSCHVTRFHGDGSANANAQIHLLRRWADPTPVRRPPPPRTERRRSRGRRENLRGRGGIAALLSATTCQSAPPPRLLGENPKTEAARSTPGLGCRAAKGISTTSITSGTTSNGARARRARRVAPIRVWLRTPSGSRPAGGSGSTMGSRLERDVT